jgi:hypothetical protein
MTRQWPDEEKRDSVLRTMFRTPPKPHKPALLEKFKSGMAGDTVVLSLEKIKGTKQAA